MEKRKVTGKTRCSQYGTVLECPHCGQPHTVYHLSWSALLCNGFDGEVPCGRPVSKTDFYFVRHQTPDEYFAAAYGSWSDKEEQLQHLPKVENPFDSRRR